MPTHILTPSFRRIRPIVTSTALILALLLTGCFTGIESTPKITASDVRRSGANSEGPESKVMAGVHPEAYAGWTPGKTFVITDQRITSVLAPGADALGTLTGKVIRYCYSADVTGITGRPTAELTFTTESCDTLRYRADASMAELAERANWQVPFTIDMAMVGEAAQRLMNRTFFILTSFRYDMAGESVHARRFVPVKVIGVEPGNNVYPIRLILDDGTPGLTSVLMAPDGAGSTPRTFATLFSLTDPKLNYPEISAATWDNIINSRLDIGMTRNECRMALGSPSTVKRGNNHSYAYEMWTYTDGTYLVFEDGLLKSYRR